MENKFDQKEALCILEKYGTGNFQEVMDYEIHDWRWFYKRSAGYVSIDDIGRYYKELKDQFKEKEDGY